MSGFARFLSMAVPPNTALFRSPYRKVAPLPLPPDKNLSVHSMQRGCFLCRKIIFYFFKKRLDKRNAFLYNTSVILRQQVPGKSMAFPAEVAP